MTTLENDLTGRIHKLNAESEEYDPRTLTTLREGIRREIIQCVEEGYFDLTVGRDLLDMLDQVHNPITAI